MSACPVCEESYPIITVRGPTGPYRQRSRVCATEGCILRGLSANTSTRAFDNAMKRFDASRIPPDSETP